MATDSYIFDVELGLKLQLFAILACIGPVHK